MKNVALIIGNLTHGGAEKQLYLLCKNLNKRKYNPIVFCLSHKITPYGQKIVSGGVKLICIPRISRFDMIRVLRLAIYFYIFGIDIVVSYLHIGNVYAFLARCLYFRKSSFICQVRSKESKMKSFTRWLNIKALNASDSIIINSKYLLSFVEEFFKQTPRKIRIVYNGIEAWKAVMKSDDDRMKIGIIGKDTPDKNICLFIKVANGLLEKNSNLVFHLSGRDLGPTNRFVEDIPNSAKNHFQFHGEIDNISRFLSHLDIYLSTSNSEGLPNAIMEAMASGLSVVATNVGGVSELVHHNKTGFLVPSGDLNGLIHYCNELLQNKRLCREMGKRGHEFISHHFSEKKMTAEFEDIFNQC